MSFGSTSSGVDDLRRERRDGLPQSQFEDVREGASLSQAAFGRLASLITAELGIKMPDSKLPLIRSRLQHRVRQLGLQSVDDYASLLLGNSSPEEHQILINQVTTHKTDFFREPAHFSFLLDEVLPKITAEHLRPGRPFKVWCAGCSSGEEPYTVAMVLAEYRRVQTQFDFAILGTDVSEGILASARAGVYDESRVAPVPPDLRRRYLLRSRDQSSPVVRIAPQLRNCVSLHQLNLMSSDYPLGDTFDVVFFRNVMIYFDRLTQEAVVERICRHLAPGGYLFTGHSESLAGMNVPVRTVRTSIHQKPASGGLAL